MFIGKSSQNNSLRKWVFFLFVIIAAWAFGRWQDSGTAPTSLQTDKTTQFTALTATTTVAGDLVRREVVLMGSRFDFVVSAPLAQANVAIDVAVKRIQEIEQAVSSWRPGSDIALLNERAGIGPVKIGPDAMAILERSLKLYRETNGAFDISIGPIWDLWPYRRPGQAIPTRQAITRRLPLVNAAGIQLNPDQGTGFLPRKGMKVNLGAVGKGYAAQAAVKVMIAMGIENAAVSAGGDTYLHGHKQGGPWIVGIENPRWPGKYIDRFLAGDIAVATSGDAKQSIIREGKRYGHILDPATGYPAEGVQSVSILTTDPVVADALATAVFVMGVTKGLAWVEDQPDIESLILDDSGGIHRSSGWLKATNRGGILPNHASLDEVRQKPLAATNTVGEKSNERNEQRTTPAVPIPQLFSGEPHPDLSRMVLIAGKIRQRDQPPPFLMDVTEVSNYHYDLFLQALKVTPRRFSHAEEVMDKSHLPRYWQEFRSPLFNETAAVRLAPFDAETFTKPNFPVVGVDWWDAFAFCRWAEKRLPTQKEWQWAANGGQNRIWPWGNTWNYSKANSGGEKWGEKDGYIYAAPVRSFLDGASVHGLLNMAGNVAEWTAEGFVTGGSSRANPSGVRANSRLLREPDFRSFDIGFRCVRSD